MSRLSVCALAVPTGSPEVQADRAAHAGAVVGAVAVRDLVQVLLVVVLGEVELAGRDDLGRDLTVAVLGELLAVLGRGLLRGLALLLVLVEDRGPVLGTDVVPLAHALRGVMRLPEHLEQLRVGDLARVEDDPHRLRVAGHTGAYLFVGRVGRVAALVAHRGGDHARYLPERALLTPEAAERELGDLAALGVRRRRRRAEHLMPLGHGHRRAPPWQRPLRADHLRLTGPENAHRASLDVSVGPQPL